MKELSMEKRFLLNQLIEQVKEGLEKGIQAGIALKRIRDERLWEEDYDSLEHFCFTKFGFKQAHAYRLIEWSDIKNSPMGEKIQNERQARAILSAPEENREKILSTVSKNGKITAKAILQEIKQIYAEEIVFDKTEAAFEVPKAILPNWKRAEEVGREVVRKVSELKCFLEKGKEDDDLIFRELSITAAAYAKNLYTAVKSIAPYSVCTSCQGIQADKCVTCKQRGFFSKDFYDRAIPVEMKTLRNKAKK